MSKPVKLTYIFFAGIVLGSIIHNFGSAILGFEEPVFFFVSILSIPAFFISAIYTLIRRLVKGEPKDIWKLGFLGLLGLVTIMPNFRPVFYIWFAFFGFFIFKK